MKKKKLRAGGNALRLTLFFIAMVLAFITMDVEAGTWTALSATPSGGVQLMMLMTDGTVACYDGSSNADTGGDWYRLVPDSSGSYVNGTFVAMATLNDARRYQSSQILRDGRIFIAGGEYGAGATTAEIYNPLNNTWTRTPSPGVTDFVDSPSMLLPDGRVLVYPNNHGTITRGTKIYNPVANTWIDGPACLASQNEASWVKLPDDSILTVDKNATTSERYIPALNRWIADDTVTVPLYGAGSEIGAAVLLMDGRAFVLGGNGNTAFYTPSGTTNNGSWATGPDIPLGLACPDAPAAVMINGKVLFTASPTGAGTNVFTSPTSYFEFDPVANTYARQNSPYGPLTDDRATFTTCMLCLPNGQVLYSDQSSQLYVYTTVGSALSIARPTLTGVSYQSNGRLKLSGTKFNGLNAGAYYGDDLQMDSNYPLVRFSSGGSVYYGKTLNWSSTGVSTGSELVTTELDYPSTVDSSPNTPFSMFVVANGVPSTAHTFYGPVWVDFNYNGVPFEFGTISFPYNTFAEGVANVTSGGTILLKPGSQNVAITVTKAMTISAVGGSAIIGK
jgi:hypothetical protein